MTWMWKKILSSYKFISPFRWLKLEVNVEIRIDTHVVILGAKKESIFIFSPFLVQWSRVVKNEMEWNITYRCRWTCRLTYVDIGFVSDKFGWLCYNSNATAASWTSKRDKYCLIASLHWTPYWKWWSFEYYTVLFHLSPATIKKLYPATVVCLNTILLFIIQKISEI